MKFIPLSHKQPPQLFLILFLQLKENPWTGFILIFKLSIRKSLKYVKSFSNRIRVEIGKLFQLLVFSITPFKIDQNKNQNRSIDKDPRQISGQRNISYTRYSKKCFTQIYWDLHGDAMLVPIRMSSNMVDGNQQKHLLTSFATKAWISSSRNS